MGKGKKTSKSVERSPVLRYRDYIITELTMCKTLVLILFSLYFALSALWLYSLYRSCLTQSNDST